MSLMRRIPFPQNLTRTVDRRPTRVAYALPTFFTAGNMFFGFVAVMKAFEGAMLMARDLPGANVHFVIAAQMIGLAVLLDGLDGRIARMTNTTSDFGREMDSMADAITFGVAPAVLAFRLGFSWDRHQRQRVRPRSSFPARIFCVLPLSALWLRPPGALQHHDESDSEKSRPRRIASISSACRSRRRQASSRRSCMPWTETRFTGGRSRFAGSDCSDCWHF